MRSDEETTLQMTVMRLDITQTRLRARRGAVELSTRCESSTFIGGTRCEDLLRSASTDTRAGRPTPGPPRVYSLIPDSYREVQASKKWVC